MLLGVEHRAGGAVTAEAQALPALRHFAGTQQRCPSTCST
jgi:hypothetical protein